MQKNNTSYSLVLVTHNASEFLEDLAKHIEALTTPPQEIIIVDSASGDDTNQLIPRYFPNAIHLPQVMNVDFCKGYNIGIARASNPYVLMINQRITLSPDCVTLLLKRMQQEPRLAVLGPKLLQPDGKTIDSMGIITDKRRHFSNVGEGKIDSGQYDHTPVFGVTGAALLLRKAAFEDIALHGGGGEQEYFDNDFVAYKDDIDIAYRLRHRGWNLAVEPGAMMYYNRNAAANASRAGRSRRVKINSLRNQWWLLLKNEPLPVIIKDLFWILLYESMKITYILFTDPKTIFGVIPSYFRALPQIFKKRSAIQTSSTATKEVTRWFI